MRLLGLREIFITYSEIVRIGKGKGERKKEGKQNNKALFSR